MFRGGVSREAGSGAGQLCRHVVDRGADAGAEHRVLVMDQQQPLGGAGHRHVEQAGLVRLVFAGLRHHAQLGNDHQRKFQTLAGMHADQLHDQLVPVRLEVLKKCKPELTMDENSVWDEMKELNLYFSNTGLSAVLNKSAMSTDDGINCL